MKRVNPRVLLSAYPDAIRHLNVLRQDGMLRVDKSEGPVNPKNKPRNNSLNKLHGTDLFY